ncbi:MAG: DUF1330 domain-containing protein [Pseudomonadota bacterium]
MPTPEPKGPQPKGYVIAHATVTDAEAWGRYAAKTQIALDKFGGKPVVRGGRHEIIEGQGTARNVVLEFPSYEAALGYAKSPEYAAAKAERQGAGHIDITVVEGV